MKKDSELLTYVGNRIDEIRREKKITETMLASKVEVSKTSISKIIQGEADMRLSTFYGVCSALDVCPEELLPKRSIKENSEFNLDAMKFKMMNVPPASRRQVDRIVTAVLDSFTQV